MKGIPYVFLSRQRGISKKKVEKILGPSNKPCLFKHYNQTLISSLSVMIGKLKLKTKKSEELTNNLKKNKQTGDLSEVTSTRKKLFLHESNIYQFDVKN